MSEVVNSTARSQIQYTVKYSFREIDLGVDKTFTFESISHDPYFFWGASRVQPGYHLVARQRAKTHGDSETRTYTA